MMWSLWELQTLMLKLLLPSRTKQGWVHVVAPYACPAVVVLELPAGHNTTPNMRSDGVWLQDPSVRGMCTTIQGWLLHRVEMQGMLHTQEGRGSTTKTLFCWWMHISKSRSRSNNLLLEGKEPQQRMSQAHNMKSCRSCRTGAG